MIPSEEETEFLAAPLLRSDSDDTSLSSDENIMEISTGDPDEDGPMYSSGPSDGGLKMIVYKLIQTKTVADVLPGVLQVILTSGKMSGMVFVGAYLAFLGIWFPIYLFSRLVGEKGIYALTVVTIFTVGRSIIRLLAFPGSTNRVSSEIEKEFSKYSVRMLTASSISIMDLAQAIGSAGTAQSGPQSYTVYEIPAMWKRAKSYRDRVLAVYKEVLQYIYDDSSDQASSPIMSNTTKYGNNKLSGDIGDLSGLTVSVEKIDCFLHSSHVKKFHVSPFPSLQLEPMVRNSWNTSIAFSLIWTAWRNKLDPCWNRVLARRQCLRARFA